MSIEERLRADLKTAMRARDDVRKTTIRMALEAEAEDRPQRIAVNVLRLFARHLGDAWTVARLRDDLRLVPTPSGAPRG